LRAGAIPYLIGASDSRVAVKDRWGAEAGGAAMISLQIEHACNRGRVPRCDGLRHGVMVAGIIMGAALIPGDMIASSSAAELHDLEYARPLFLTVGKSRTLRIERPFTKAVVAAPDIADVLPISNQVIYVQAKKVGTTNVSLFNDEAQVVAIIDLAVSVDTANLQQQIRASTGSSAIRVSASGSQVILSGMAADALAADRALAVAKGLAPEGVVNAMQVAPPQQVMLEVRFLEVTRDAGRQLGVNLTGATQGPNGVNRGFSTGLPNTSPFVNTTNPPPTIPAPPLNNTTAQALGAPGTVGIPVIATAGTLLSAAGGPFGRILANLYSNNGTTLDVLITALETKGLARRLAEPNLIALSGDTARFLAGGEYPIPVPAATPAGGVPTIAIEYKKFGVQLAFVPTVLSRGVINLRVEPSVSELDFTNTVQYAGLTVPSLITRDARTTVELRDGQSFAVAGLLQTRNAKELQQLPWIGSVPVLGALFRSSAFLQNETELVIIVTPRLVAPAVPGQQLASPLDSRLNSNDLDFFLNGQPELRKRYIDYVSVGGDLKGPYGHIVAPDPAGSGVVVRARN
jgi:pilus assembly protein CpaC